MQFSSNFLIEITWNAYSYYLHLRVVRINDGTVVTNERCVVQACRLSGIEFEALNRG